MFPKGGNPCRSGDGGTVRPSYNDGTMQTIEMPKQETHVHTFGNWTAFTDSDTPCENRLFFRTCSDCKIIEWKQGSYTDHDWNVVTTPPPTCQAKGYDTKTCEICGKIEVDNYTNIVDHDSGLTGTEAGRLESLSRGCILVACFGSDTKPYDFTSVAEMDEEKRELFRNNLGIVCAGTKLVMDRISTAFYKAQQARETASAPEEDVGESFCPDKSKKSEMEVAYKYWHYVDNVATPW